MQYFSISLTLILLFIKAEIQGQNFQGIAYYEYSNSYSKVDWDDGLSRSIVNEKKAYLRNNARKTYVLHFNTFESNWQEVESLEVNSEGGSKGAFGENVIRGLLYKNLQEQTFDEEVEAFDKRFLLKDDLELPEWQLTQEEKQIGEYTATKAFYLIQSEKLVFGLKEPQTTTQKVEAWFTPQIPLSHGPSEYWGLPGLILELRVGNQNYICNKIELNPKDGFSIAEPEKGKEVSKKQLQVIIEEKTQEMKSQYKKRGRKKG